MTRLPTVLFTTSAALALLLILPASARASVVGCNVDAECPTGDWCDESISACTPELPNGQDIPNDPPHTDPSLRGLCTPDAAALVCTSGVCDSNDNECGYAGGDGPCTVSSGSIVCRSEACSVTDVCLPAPGSCIVDADCSGGRWCNESTRTCTVQSVNGAPIPDDSQHSNPPLDGICTAAAGQLVCSSGVCDDNDNKCGYASGDGPCTASTGDTVCRSGACSVIDVCLPAPGSCVVDADCSGGRWCNESTLTCTVQSVNGAPVPTDSQHSNPTLDGVCTAAAGQLVCSSGVCDDNDNKCGYASGDGPCTASTGSTVCRSGACSVIDVCLAAGTCDVDADCSGGQWCDESTHTCTAQIANGNPIPNDPPHVNPMLDGVCTAAVGQLVCSSGVCDRNDNECGYASGDGPCTATNGATVCQSQACSVAGNCIPAGGCAVDGDCADNLWCDDSTATCSPQLPNGAPIPTASNPPLVTTLDGVCTSAAAWIACISGVCDTNDNKCGYATGDGPCTASSAGVVCRSGSCSSDGSCDTAGGCAVDADCSAGLWCNEAASMCTPDLANGAPIPMDPPHTDPSLNGMCTIDAGSLVCVSGVCDAADNACGYADGDGPCTVMTGGAVCRSGTCSEAGICIVAGGCAVDADCGSTGSWCDEATSTCSAPLPNGLAIPTDPSHVNPALDGVCTMAAAQLVCASGVCDTADNECGYANGDGVCTTTTAGTVCRSSACSANGACEPLGGCNVNADCTALDPICDATTNTCTPAPVDAGPVDAGAVDAGPVDAGPVDAGPVDAGSVDAGPSTVGPADGGTGHSSGGGCASGEASAMLGALAAAFAQAANRRRRRSTVETR